MSAPQREKRRHVHWTPWVDITPVLSLFGNVAPPEAPQPTYSGDLDGERERWKSHRSRYRSYLVSSLGRVWSLRSKWLLRPQPDQRGYLHLQLGRGTFWKVHRLVMVAFYGPLPNGWEVNHLNGDKEDNRLANLEYVTRSGNVRHSIQVLGNPKPPRMPGTKHPNVILTEEKARAIKYAPPTARTCDLAQRFGISESVVQSIRHRRAWKHV